MSDLKTKNALDIDKNKILIAEMNAKNMRLKLDIEYLTAVLKIKDLSDQNNSDNFTSQEKLGFQI